MRTNDRIKSLIFILGIVLSVILLNNVVVKSFYDAKKIYNEEKPAIINEERLDRQKDNEVLILLYHNVTEDRSIKDDLYVYLDDFRAQLDYIVENQYNVITMEQLYEMRKENQEIPDKTIVLTFDDGDKSSFDIIFPELQSRNLKGSFFLTTRQLNDRGYVTKEEVIEMHEAGHDIQSQGHDNEDFIDSSLASTHRSLYLSKKILEELLNKKILFLVYPNSSFNSEIIRLAQDVGYEWALSTESGLFYDHYLVAQRMSIPGAADLEEFKVILSEFNY